MYDKLLCVELNVAAFTFSPSDTLSSLSHTHPHVDSQLQLGQMCGAVARVDEMIFLLLFCQAFRVNHLQCVICAHLYHSNMKICH